MTETLPRIATRETDPEMDSYMVVTAKAPEEAPYDEELHLISVDNGKTWLMAAIDNDGKPVLLPFYDDEELKEQIVTVPHPSPNYCIAFLPIFL